MSKITKEELKDLQELQGKLNAIKHDIRFIRNSETFIIAYVR